MGTQQKGLICVWRKVRFRGGHRYLLICTGDPESSLNICTGDHECERLTTRSLPKEILKREKEEARHAPNPGLLTFLGLSEGSEVYAWCMNGHTAPTRNTPPQGDGV